MHQRSDFGKDRNTPEGLAYSCKFIVSQRNKANHDKNHERLNARHAERRLDRKKSSISIEWAMKKLVADARRRATTKDIAFDLDAKLLERPTHCPLLGFELIYQADHKRLPNSASIDRIDSRHGYVHWNVWVISWRANQIKSDATLDELRRICDGLGKRAAGRLLDEVQHDGYPA